MSTPAETASPERIEIRVPRLGESINEAIVARWLKQPGDRVAADEAVVELDTDKVAVDVYAPVAGVLSEQRAVEGETIQVGDVIAVLTADSAQSKSTSTGADEPAAATATPPPSSAPASPGSSAPAPPPVSRRVDSPSTRKARREAAARQTPQASTDPESPPKRLSPALSTDERIEPMSPIRKRIAKRLVDAQQSAAILSTFNECDLTEVIELRRTHGEAFQERHGVKLGFMSFFVKASVGALADFPGLNAEIRGTDIVYKRRFHVGVAVGSDRGLVVPVIRNADTLGFADIERAIVEYVDKIRTNRLAPDDLQGGTFTITNGGIYGSMLSTPLLNFPQSGILGMHNIQRRPVAIGETIVIRPMMYLALSYDHRIVDGREAVQFLIGVKDRIEHPGRVFLDL